MYRASKRIVEFGNEPNIFKLVVLEIRETHLNYVVSETNQIQNIKIISNFSFNLGE